MIVEGSVVRELWQSLEEDAWRKSHPFSDDVSRAHAVMFHPFATDGDRQRILSAWFQDEQPCLFGSIAAASNALHYVFITDADLQNHDSAIGEKLAKAQLAWRRRSVKPLPGVSSPAHGLVVAVISPRIAYARPNIALHRLSSAVLKLMKNETSEEPQGSVQWQHLFLQNPTDKRCVRFKFSVDFFATAGDRRWWHDHRIPGGIAFTANSVGHMRRYREWYKGKSDQRGWIVKTAMGTIFRAAETEYGKATWLRDLVEGKPFVEGIACPFAGEEKDRPELAGKDWTRYAGYLHTDHSIRSEFFRESPEREVEGAKEWVQDFQYLYDETLRDHLRFAAGEVVSNEEVTSEIGRPEDYVEIEGPKRTPRARKEADEVAIAALEPGSEAELEELLRGCEDWELSQRRLKELDS